MSSWLVRSSLEWQPTSGNGSRAVEVSPSRSLPLIPQLRTGSAKAEFFCLGPKTGAAVQRLCSDHSDITLASVTCPLDCPAASGPWPVNSRRSFFFRATLKLA